MEKQSAMRKLKEFGRECTRVLKITKKPTGKEYKTILAITGIGILVVGLIGFIITMIKQVFL